MHRLTSAIAFALVVCTPVWAVADDVAPPERLIVLLGELAGDLESAGADVDGGPDDPVDCDAVAGALDTWTQSHAVELGQLVGSVDRYLDALPRTEIRALETRMAPYVDAVVVAAIDCAAHDGTMAALESMEDVLTPGSAAGETAAGR